VSKLKPKVSISEHGVTLSKPEHALKHLSPGARFGSLEAGYTFLVTSLRACAILALTRIPPVLYFFCIYILVYTRNVRKVK
jgi:hypothetical protein